MKNQNIFVCTTKIRLAKIHIPHRLPWWLFTVVTYSFRLLVCNKHVHTFQDDHILGPTFAESHPNMTIAVKLAVSRVDLSGIIKHANKVKLGKKKGMAKSLAILI